MENQIVVNQNNLQMRDIDTVTGEIITIKTQAQNTLIAYAIEIGKRLVEAKSMLNHGEWGAWLEEKVDFSQSSANNYMKLYEEYGSQNPFLLGFGANSQTFGNLTYAKAIKLLAIPSEEREEFIVKNDIENKSTRETDKLIKEHKQALEEKKRLEEENQRLKGYQKEAEEAKKMALKAQTILADKEKELEELKDEMESAVTPSLSDEELNEIKKDAELEAQKIFNKKLEDERSKLEAEIAAAKAEKEAAEERAKEANAKITELEKQTKLSSPLVTEFKTVYEDFQVKGGKLLQIILDVKKEDEETAAKLRKALDAVLSQLS